MAVPSQFNNRLGPLGAFGGEFDTFTGLAEETILGNAISVNYKSDQDTFMTLQQAPDGVNWYIQDQKLLVANEEHIFQHPAVLPFFRVIIQNRGLVDQTFGDLITSLVQIQTNNIGVVATIGDITPTKDGVLTYGLSGASPLAMRVDASGSLITTSTATGASAASVTAWGKDSLGASYPLPLTTGGAEIAMSITDPLPAGTAHIGEVSISNLPSVQEVSGTVTVASITEPLPQGTNTLGAVKLEGYYSGTGQALNPTTFFMGTGGSVGENAVALVTTMDAKSGNASSAICAIDTQNTGSVEYLNCIKVGDGLYGPIRALQTYETNFPTIQTIEGTVTVASITEPLPQGTNTLGAVRTEGQFNDGTTISLVQTSAYLFEAIPSATKGYIGSGLIGASVVTMDAFDGNATTGVCAIDDAWAGGQGGPQPAGMSYLTSRYIPPHFTAPTTNSINSLHTWVDNHPAVQDISGTVTVASITDPLPVGTNTIGGVKLVGTNDRGVDVLTLNPTVFQFPSGDSVGQNAVALVTTTDAKFGNASTSICAVDVTGTGEAEFLSCVQVQLTDIYSVNSLHTWVDNHPVVQVVAGQETPYIGFATPETNIAQVYADGIPGINVTGGWSYTSTQVGVAPYTGSRNKINWYLYNSATPDTDFAVSQLATMYAVINQKSTLGIQAQLPFFTIYTRPDSGVNNGGTFFKNRLTFGGQSFAGTQGMMLLYTGDDPVAIHPEITGANRLRLDFNTGASTTTLQAASGEGAYLASLQTGSEPKPNGTRNFVFSEFSMMWEQSAIPLPISQNQVQVFDKALNASAATLVTDLSGITITANKLQVGGTVAVSNFPATQPVSGSVSISNLPATQPVSGTVAVSNLPATQTITGTVAISNFPEGGSNVSIVSPLPAGTNSIGSVTVSNFPAGGSNVSVTNFPATQPVSGTFWPTTQPVSGTVAISNFPAGGSEVSVTNFPATQPISGTVAISNFPAGGSEVSIVSALPTGANVIGAVNINSSYFQNSYYDFYDVTYGDGISTASYIQQYKSVDIIIIVSQVNNPDTQDGMTLNIQVSNDGSNFGTLPGYTMNFKGQNPPPLAINNIQTNASWIRVVALKANNPSSMSMFATTQIMSKY